MAAAKTPAAIDLDAGLAGIAAMNVEQLRELWRQKRGQEPPAAFSDRPCAGLLAHEGWRLVPDRFDHGAFSGASLDRPALQALLDEVRSQKIVALTLRRHR